MDKDSNETINYLKSAFNSLSCFSDIQAHFVPFRIGDENSEPEKLDIPQ